MRLWRMDVHTTIMARSLCALCGAKVVEDYLIEDTQTLMETLRCLNEQGVKEAHASPLRDA